MTNEDLKLMREKFEELKNKRTEVLKMGEAIETYEQHPAVKKYLELLALYKKNTTGVMYEFDKKTDEDLLHSAITSVIINDTNNIYVYMGSYIKSNGSSDCRVKKDDPQADYRLYRNLELMAYQEGYEISVPINECKNFEEKYMVIFPYKTYSNDQYYLKLRRIFFDTAVLEGQEKAFEKIKRLNIK